MVLLDNLQLQDYQQITSLLYYALAYSSALLLTTVKRFVLVTSSFF
jgi:hypothetical protein